MFVDIIYTLPYVPSIPIIEWWIVVLKNDNDNNTVFIGIYHSG